MKIEIESTTKLIELEINGVTVPARIWEGHTASGIPIHTYITRIAAPRVERLEEFERELKENKPPSPAIEAIPLRLIL